MSKLVMNTKKPRRGMSSIYTHLEQFSSRSGIFKCHLKVSGRRQGKGDDEKKQSQKEADICPNRTYQVDEGKNSKDHIVQA